jgi:hypothetical protein
MVVNETHTFRGTWLMYAILLLELPTLILMVVLWQTGHLGDDGPIAVAVVGSIMILLFLLILNIKLQVRLDRYGLAFRNPPFINGWKKFSVEEILEAKVKKTDGMFEYGGIGLRMGRKFRAYIFLADYLLEIKTAKRKYAFSLKDPVLAEELLAEWKEQTSIDS